MKESLNLIYGEIPDEAPVALCEMGVIMIDSSKNTEET